MNPRTHLDGRVAIVYDADRITAPGKRLFERAHWEASGAVTGHAPGRGETLMLDTPFGPSVLRPYLRGGWPARFSRDRYLFTGTGRSRGFREFHLLRRLSAAGLPVPAPLAAACERAFLSCRCAILMQRIEGVAPLAQFAGRAEAGSPAWRLAGACIRDFHRSGVRHADLNAGNILIDDRHGRAFLVDFDRGSYTPGKPVEGSANLARLRRSLSRLWPSGSRPGFEACWRALLEGYGG